MKRREFLKNSIFIPAAGVTLFYTISSCSDDSTSATSGNTIGTQPVGTCTTVSAVIGGNHGHTMVAPNAGEVAAMAPIILNLTVVTGHTHTVSLTTQDLSDISTCGTATVGSIAGGGHTHAVTFTGA